MENTQNIIFEPLYPYAEAARYINVAPNTLRYWFHVLKQGNEPQFLSFANLIEAYVIKALGEQHAVKLKAILKATFNAEKHLNIKWLLLRKDLLTTGGDLFLNYYDQLVNLSKSNQLGIKTVLQSYLKRVEWENNLPSKLYPYLLDVNKFIEINPKIRFGRPIIKSKGVETAIIYKRINVGEKPEFVAKDYGITMEEIEMAIAFENQIHKKHAA